MLKIKGLKSTSIYVWFSSSSSFLPSLLDLKISCRYRNYIDCCVYCLLEVFKLLKNVRFYDLNYNFELEVLGISFLNNTGVTCDLSIRTQNTKKFYYRIISIISPLSICISKKFMYLIPSHFVEDHYQLQIHGVE